jgi:cytidine deaminase
MTTIDWTALRDAAVAACERAYVPYSEYPVGVAGLVDDGRVLTACNVENASYGLTLCAECGLVSALHATGGGRLVAVACVDGRGQPLVPCGRCRQLLHEHGGPGLLFNARPLDELLPDAFGPDHLRPRPAPGVAPLLPPQVPPSGAAKPAASGSAGDEPNP